MPTSSQVLHSQLWEHTVCRAMPPAPVAEEPISTPQAGRSQTVEPHKRGPNLGSSSLSIRRWEFHSSIPHSSLSLSLSLSYIYKCIYIYISFWQSNSLRGNRLWLQGVCDAPQVLKASLRNWTVCAQFLRKKRRICIHVSLQLTYVWDPGLHPQHAQETRQ